MFVLLWRYLLFMAVFLQSNPTAFKSLSGRIQICMNLGLQQAIIFITE